MKSFSLTSVIRAGVWGTVLGGSAGFALGLLLAPEEGQRLRRRVAYKLERLAEQLGTYVEQVMQQPPVGNEARRTADAVVADAREQAERIRAEIDALLVDVRRGGAPVTR